MLRKIILVAALTVSIGSFANFFDTIKSFFVPKPKPAIEQPLPVVNAKKPWIGNQQSTLRASGWYVNHQYGDCPQTANGDWSSSLIDCLIPDQLDGPSAKDIAIIPDPAGLYYKHMTPGDFAKLFPDLTMEQRKSLIQGRLSNVSIPKDKIKTAATVSFDSLMVGLDEDKAVRSVSLMVHPQIENVIVKLIGTEERAKNLYQPFIEQAINQTIPLADANALYVAALDRCGKNAKNGDQSGWGEKRIYGNYTAVVQWWETGDGTKDCNIHVVANASL